MQKYCMTCRKPTNWEEQSTGKGTFPDPVHCCVNCNQSTYVPLFRHQELIASFEEVIAELLRVDEFQAANKLRIDVKHLAKRWGIFWDKDCADCGIHADQTTGVVCSFTTTESPKDKILGI